MRKVFIGIVFVMLQNAAAKPMRGFNSWNSFAQWINETQLLAQADFMVSSGMASLGWEYVISDGGWYYPSDSGKGIMTEVVDEYGRFLPTPDRYPSGWKKICDTLHSKYKQHPFKCGFHLFRGVASKAWELSLPIKNSPQGYTARDAGTNLTTHGAFYDFNMSHPAATQYIDSMFELYCSWGIDFIKLDGVGGDTRKDETSYAAISAYRNAIDKYCTGRNVVISLSAGGTAIPGWGNATQQAMAAPDDSYISRVSKAVQMVRVTPDTWDIWDDEPWQTPCPLTALWAKLKPPKGTSPEYANSTGHSGCCWGGRINKHFEEFAVFAHIADKYGVYPDGDMLQLGRVGSYPNLTAPTLRQYGVSDPSKAFPVPPAVSNCSIYQLLGLQSTGIMYDPGMCPRQSYLTYEEQRTLFTLWSIARSPLIMGGDMTQSPPEIIKLLTNKDVLGVNEFGRNATQVRLDRTNGIAIWVSSEDPNLFEGHGISPAKFLAVFNLLNRSQDVDASFSLVFGSSKSVTCTNVTDLWSHEALGAKQNHIVSRSIPRHGSVLYSLRGCGSDKVTREVPQSQYPLLHIGDKLNCSGKGPCEKAHTTTPSGFHYNDYPYPMTDSDVDVLNAYSLIHVSTKDPAQVASWHQRAPQAKAVKYIESQPVCGGSGGQDTAYVVGCNNTINFETGGFRRDAMVYQIGNLTTSLKITDNTVSYCQPDQGVACCKKYGALLRPSTAPGDYSDYGNGSRYVTFVRLGDELMKIVGAKNISNPDPKSKAPCQELQVVRGLDGTTPTSAPLGFPLLAPLYAKQPTWTDSNAGKLVYQADYRSVYAWSSLANFTVDAVKQLGYNGAWVDSFSPSEFKNNADPDGNKVAVWDVVNGERYTASSSFSAQMERLQKVWASVKTQLGYYPDIWANNFENWFPAAQAGTEFPGDRLFMLNHSGNRPFDGCSLESWTVSFQGSCFPQTGEPGKKNIVQYNDEATWIGRVNNLIDAARYNLTVAAMTGSAGCQSPLQIYIPESNRTKLDLLHYASYLLAVNRAGDMPHDINQPLVGTTAFFPSSPKDGSGLGIAKFWEPYSWQLGPPKIPTPSNFNVTSWRVKTPGLGIGVYIRYFAKGVVIVNPGTQDATTEIPLANGPYSNPLTSEKGITKVKPQHQSGTILLS
eukprot:m.12887 g.12887  ORF g.12887 m.12887 type:complete len:1151 (-) comp4749_c0_seq1:169-3621(-)